MTLFKRRPAGPDDVRDELEWILDGAWAFGLSEATVTAASLHGRVCSNRNTRVDLMPTCISVMQGAMRPGDERVGSDEKSAFAVRYRLEPRREISSELVRRLVKPNRLRLAFRPTGGAKAS